MSNTTVREFIRNYENGTYSSPRMRTMIEAGWCDWFCEDEELKPRLDAMFQKVKQIAMSSKIDMDRMYVYFKNNCLMEGGTYDDFRFCDIPGNSLVYTITLASGHRKTAGQSEVWGKENDFKEALAKGTWDDIENFFKPEEKNTNKLTLEKALAKRNEARSRRRSFDDDDYETPKGLLNAEYDWGFWDAVITIMKNCGMKELDAKAVL